MNWGLNLLDGKGGLEGWRYMYLVQGLMTMVIGFATYFWMVDFPEKAQNSLWFLTKEEQEMAVRRIQRDRRDVKAEVFAWRKVLVHAKDVKVYG